MTPYYLRFTDEAEAMAKLQEAGLRRLGTMNIQGVKLPTWHMDNGVDVIGESYRNDAQHDGMTLVRPATKRDGYFVNWLGAELPAVLEPYRTSPATPFRVFAGFHPDEIAAREAKPARPL